MPLVVPRGDAHVETPRRGLRQFDRDVGLVLFAYIVLLAFENVAVGVGYRVEFAGTWEMTSARKFLSPISLALLVPVAMAVVAMARLAARRQTALIVIATGIAGGAMAFFGSTGRTMESVTVRAPFVAVVAVVVAFVAWGLARRLPSAPPSIVATASLVIATGAWLADAFVLPRLYPAFHAGLLVVCVVAWAGTSLFLGPSSRRSLPAWAGILIASASIAWAPHAAVQVSGQDNLRRVLLEHAPILGRAVVVAAKIAPPPPLDEDTGAAATTLTNLLDRKGARTVDWRGRDIVLVTVDALRADHVSSYGYGRKTTPNIDALAADGVRFEHAYCPTPHTSYSITSMMTGKYMKPLLALSSTRAAADAEAGETWAQQVRRYGYRTAAFYPPAVFFIDAHRFQRMKEENLGFEYYKAEYARPDLRTEQVTRYLGEAPRDKPLFLWVHLFEPHEPYEMHADHPFSGDPRVDAYDSEIAAADAFVGDLVRLVGERRPPGAVFIVSADHGEEHGDHGGRYHGTTVYEEQVRVPLVVRAPGLAPQVVRSPVQTIDLLPTTLAALDVPIPPRLRGRDLGPALVGAEAKGEEGLAFAETDDYTLVARGDDRLVCARKIASCTLFDVAHDPMEKQPVASRPARVDELRKLTAVIERDTGKVEASVLPDALRRGLQGDLDAAEDVAPLLDDARVDIRRLAARCGFALKSPQMASSLRRAVEHDEDLEVRRFASLALARMDARPDAENTKAPSVDGLLRANEADVRVAAALTLAESGDGRGEGELVLRWTAAFAEGTRTPGEIGEARELLAAFGKLRSKAAVPALVRSLDDVRLRPHIVEALGNIGDPRAKEPLVQLLSNERYVHLRPLEARVLFGLGARKELAAPLMRFAGTPEPMVEAIAIAADARLLTADRGGKDWPPSGVLPASFDATVRLGAAGPCRLLVLASDDHATITATIDGLGLDAASSTSGTALHVFEVGSRPAGDARLSLGSSRGIRAAWLVPRAAEIPPPPPKAWEPSTAATDAGL